jgi:hypothetical protein
VIPESKFFAWPQCFDRQSRWVSEVHRIVGDIRVQIAVPAVEKDRIPRRPPAGARLVIPCPEANENRTFKLA